MAIPEKPKLVGFQDRAGTLEAQFECGVSVHLHNASGRSDLFYAMRPYTREGHTLVHPRARAYQAAALRAFFSDAPFTTKIDRDGDLVARKVNL